MHLCVRVHVCVCLPMGVCACACADVISPSCRHRHHDANLSLCLSLCLSLSLFVFLVRVCFCVCKCADVIWPSRRRRHHDGADDGVPRDRQPPGPAAGLLLHRARLLPRYVPQGVRGRGWVSGVGRGQGLGRGARGELRQVSHSVVLDYFLRTSRSGGGAEGQGAGRRESGLGWGLRSNHESPLSPEKA